MKLSRDGKNYVVVLFDSLGGASLLSRNKKMKLHPTEALNQLKYIPVIGQMNQKMINELALNKVLDINLPNETSFAPSRINTKGQGIKSLGDSGQYSKILTANNPVHKVVMGCIPFKVGGNGRGRHNKYKNLYGL